MWRFVYGVGCGFIVVVDVVDVTVSMSVMYDGIGCNCGKRGGGCDVDVVDGADIVLMDILMVDVMMENVVDDVVVWMCDCSGCSG